MPFFSLKGAKLKKLTDREESSEEGVYPLFVAVQLPPDPKVAERAINDAWQSFVDELPSSISELSAPEVSFDDSGQALFSSALLTPLSMIEGLEESLIRTFAKHGISARPHP